MAPPRPAALRASGDPSLSPEERDRLTKELMRARRAKQTAIRAAGDDAREVAREQARAAVDAAKRALGERGPVWWRDGAPDFNRHLAINTPYASWFRALEQRED